MILKRITFYLWGVSFLLLFLNFGCAGSSYYPPYIVSDTAFVEDPQDSKTDAP